MILNVAACHCFLDHCIYAHFYFLSGVILKFVGQYLLANLLPLAMVFGCLNLYKSNVRGKTN